MLNENETFNFLKGKLPTAHLDWAQGTIFVTVFPETARRPTPKNVVDFIKAQGFKLIQESSAMLGIPMQRWMKEFRPPTESERMIY